MPAAFVVRLLPGAVDDLARVERDVYDRVVQGLRRLAEDPLPHGKPDIKVLKGSRPPLLRLRCGDHRVVYRFAGDAVEVLAVVARRDLERRLRRLRP